MKKKMKNDVGVAPMGDSKRQKGITLVALIITIIVLLILAVVAIRAVQGDGIIAHAKNARADYEKAAEEENGILQNAADYITSQVGNSGDITSADSLVEMYKAGTLKVGDYVGYHPNVGVAAYDPDAGAATPGTQTGFVSGVKDWIGNSGGNRQNITQENLNWRVLGYNEETEELLLISGAPTSQGITLYGHVGYNNGETILNTACNTLYSNSSLGVTARSITMNDIDTYLDGNNFNKTTYGGGSSKSGGYGYQGSFTNIYTPEQWSASWSGTLTSDYFNYTATNYITNNIKLDILLGKNDYYYWLASRSVNVSSGAYWGLGYVGEGLVYAGDDYLCYSGGREKGDSLCLRPVVSLKSNVTTKDVPILEEAPTEVWNDPLGQY